VKLYVKVIAISEEHGLKSTREELVEIPVKVQRLNEVVMGNEPASLLEGFATSALIAALGTVQIGGQNPAQDIITGAGGAPIGGRQEEPYREPGAPAPGPGARQGGGDPLAKALGLDIIEAMDARERHARPTGPGPIGFGNTRGR
jgi:hypothetical protein